MKQEKAGGFRTFFGLTAQNIRRSSLPQSAVIIAFYSLLSLCPIIVIIGTLFPYFNIDPAVVNDMVAVLIPEAIAAVVNPLVSGLLTGYNGGLLSLGILVTLWSASRCIKYLQLGIDRTYGLQKARLSITSRFVSVVFFAALMLLMIVFILLTGVGIPLLQKLMDWLGADGEILRQVNVVKWLISATALFLGFLIIYRVLPSVKNNLRASVPGALFATLGLSALVQLYSAYLKLSSRQLTMYGVLSAVFLLMLWLQLTADIILVGASVNAAVFELRFGTPVATTSRIDRVIFRFLRWFVRVLPVRIPALEKFAHSTIEQEAEEDEAYDS